VWKRARIVQLIVLATATSVLSAQTPPPNAPQTKTKPQTPVFRAATDIVSTDVFPRDANGRIVSGLTVKDFEVYEDGVKQTVSQFVSVVGGRALTEVLPVNVPVREGLVLPSKARPTVEQGRIFIIFIDDLHIQPMDTLRAKRALQQIRDTVLHDGDLVGLVSSGFSSISFDLNPDPKRLRFNQAIDKLLGAGKTPLEIRRRRPSRARRACGRMPTSRSGRPTRSWRRPKKSPTVERPSSTSAVGTTSIRLPSRATSRFRT